MCVGPVFVCLNQTTLPPCLCVCVVWMYVVQTWTVTFWPPSPGALQIEYSEESDQGKYECVAVNSAGTRYSAPANLYVRGKIPLDPDRPLPAATQVTATVRSSLVTSSAPMLCLLTANKEAGSLDSTAVKVKPVDACPVSAVTLSFPALSPFLSRLVSRVVIYVFCSNALLLVCLTCLTSQWQGGCFDSSGVKERLAVVLPLCFGEVEVYVWNLATERSWHLCRCMSRVGEDSQGIPPKAASSRLGVLQQKPAEWKQALGLLISRPCQQTTQLALTNIRFSKAIFKHWGDTLLL